MIFNIIKFKRAHITRLVHPEIESMNKEIQNYSKKGVFNLFKKIRKNN